MSSSGSGEEVQGGSTLRGCSLRFSFAQNLLQNLVRVLIPRATLPIITGMGFDVFQEAGVSEDGRATMGAYTRGGTVFTAGTTDWSHGLTKDPVVQQITRNVLNRLSRG